MENKLIELRQKFFNEFINNLVSLDETFILGISGGPDSMWLLNLMKNQKIIVACVNYNKREDSWKDEKIVRDFCYKNNIVCEIFSIEKSNDHVGNFQKIARDQRYAFYKKIYDKYKANYLVLAHHKDDCLETFLFQKQTFRHPKQYGIMPLNKINNMNIFRPMINLWYKDEILAFCNQFAIPYAIDYTNNLPIYTRNKIRIGLKKCSSLQKDELFLKLKFLNKELEKKQNLVNNEFKKFRQSNYNYKILNFDHCYINEILFEYLHANVKDIKISLNKLNSFKKFIMSQKNFKGFKINDEVIIYKKQASLKICKN
ncbi:tRNA lysidine(34) synthetase TilS [Mycoplasma sp. 2575]